MHYEDKKEEIELVIFKKKGAVDVTLNLCCRVPTFASPEYFIILYELVSSLYSHLDRSREQMD